jgi:hypothetical protein
MLRAGSVALTLRFPPTTAALDNLSFDPTPSSSGPEYQGRGADASAACLFARRFNDGRA